MGNFTSCTSASTRSLSPPPPPPPPPPNSSMPRASLIARVLLVDGSVLRFTHPVKAISLLLDYPHHFICPLDSLRPGHHSLSSLPPDEELQLGHLYLLLPFRTFDKRKNSAPESLHHEGCNYGEPINDNAPARDQTPERDDRASLLARNKSDQYSISTKHHSYIRLSSRSSRTRDDHALNQRNAASHLGYMNLHSASSRLCDKLELQKDYRSDMLRRCRTWTPRLQAITETRIAAGNNYS